MLYSLLLVSVVSASPNWEAVVSKVQSLGTFHPASSSLVLDSRYIIRSGKNRSGYSSQNIIYVWGDSNNSAFTPNSITVLSKTVLLGSNQNTYDDSWAFISDTHGTLLQVARVTTIRNPNGKIISDIDSIEQPLNLVVQEKWQELLEYWTQYAPDT